MKPDIICGEGAKRKRNDKQERNVYNNRNRNKRGGAFMKEQRCFFGTTQLGETVERVHLEKGQISCEILTWGATLQSLIVPDREGRAVDVVLGYDTMEEYEIQDGYLGAVVGRCANRIAKGRFVLGGKEYSLAVNNGPNHLHGGLRGFSHRLWRVEQMAQDQVVLCLDSPDGEEGYPGCHRYSMPLPGYGILSV